MGKQSAGFSLIELIVVIILVGILAVTTLPKQMGRGGVHEIVVSDQIYGVLQRFQTQSMQQTNNDPTAAASQIGLCQQFIVSTKAVGLADDHPCDIGSTLSLNAPEQANRYLLSSSDQLSIHLYDQGISFGGTEVSLPAIYSFNSLGQLQDAAGMRMPDGIRIEIQGEDRAKVCVNSEGFIHSC